MTKLNKQQIKRLKKIVVGKNYGKDYKAYTIFSQKTFDNLLSKGWYCIF
jgi:hypothetical protein